MASDSAMRSKESAPNSAGTWRVRSTISASGLGRAGRGASGGAFVCMAKAANRERSKVGMGIGPEENILPRVVAPAVEPAEPRFISAFLGAAFDADVTHWAPSGHVRAASTLV